jgi:hypothetical protein
MAFVAPGAKRQVRRNSMPLHIGLGLSILALVFVTVASGILEKLSFNASCNLSGTFVSTGGSSEQVQSFMAQDCVLGNIIGLLTGFALVSVIGTIWYARHQVVSGSLAVAGEREPLVSNSCVLYILQYSVILMKRLSK